MKVPLSQPDITDSEIDAVISVLRSSQLSLGAKMDEFEQRVAEFIGVPHAIAVSSGTAGLHLCMRALRIGPGDEVIVPSFTFIAAANSIRYEGATPVFIDIDSGTLNLDPALIERAITPRTKAILVVHTFGRAAEMSAILALAEQYKLLVIEDACEAIGAEYRGRKVGNFGHAAVFAFYPNKQITTAEGGMIVTHDKKYADEMRALRNHGRYPTDDWRQHSILGYNYRLSELHSALGCAQMERIDEILAKRANAAKAYQSALRGCEGLMLPRVDTSEDNISWFVYVVRVSHPAKRDPIMQALRNRGIQCGRYFAPIHQQPAYAGFNPRTSLPITEAESLRAIALPFFTNISAEQIEYIADELRPLLSSSASR